MKNKQLTDHEKNQLEEFYQREILVISTKDERPKPESLREVGMYYFDWLFGEITFLYGFIPLFKLGMVPHLALLLSLLMVVLRVRSSLALAIFTYLLGIIVVGIMKILVTIIEKRRQCFGDESDDSKK
ncbi:MAG: hypothetical protein E7156_03140 [Streptococcus gallolyticus]|uniref:Uncharacterized protein n=1 Tax=Streptococcus gallolyticus TaxID=315405 RepID=A0A927XFB3_9STRE|nr:hypothetical protein [Streptococcus gallolyticus]